MEDKNNKKDKIVYIMDFGLVVYDINDKYYTIYKRFETTKIERVSIDWNIIRLYTFDTKAIDVGLGSNNFIQYWFNRFVDLVSDDNKYKIDSPNKILSLLSRLPKKYNYFLYRAY